MKPTQTLLLAFLSASLALTGCKLIPEPVEDPTRYYTLSLPNQLDATQASLGSAARVGLRQVELSPYLRKGILVVRRGENEVLLNDYQRWAEPLEAGIARMLQTCLQADPRIAKLSTPPLRSEEARDFELIVRVRRADGLIPSVEGSGLRFVALVELHSSGPSSVLLEQRSFVAPPVTWDGRDYATLSHHISEAVQLLAKEISDMVGAKTSLKP